MIMIISGLPQLHADRLHVSEAHHETFLGADLGHTEGSAVRRSRHLPRGTVSNSNV